MPPIAKGYISASETLKGAQSTGMKVGDFVEKWYSRDACPFSVEGGVGSTQRTVDRLLSAIEVPQNAHCLEIGPCTGRYFDELFTRRPDNTCEYYETNPEWAAWLAAQYASRGLIKRIADGHSLGETPAGSIDLCTAYGVFVYLDSMVTFNYLKEMARCVKPGGVVFFDILDMDREDMVEIVEKISVSCNYLIPISKRVVIQYLLRRGLQLLTEFSPSESKDTSTYLLFTKPAAG